MSQLISCSNCLYNPLQSGSLGSQSGYCVEHRFILRRPDETTCWKHLRKDLLIDRALEQQKVHSVQYEQPEPLRNVSTLASAFDEVHQTSALGSLNGDQVTNVVTNYGEYGTKIESLAQLDRMTGPRAELARLVLGRAYTHRCFVRDHKWTSGLHLLWWTRTRLEEDPNPEVHLDDLRYHLAVSIERQIELVKWSLIMLRLVFISDIGTYASRANDQEIGSLHSLAEDAAANTETVSVRKLSRWIKKEALPRLDQVFPETKYKQTGRELHQ